MIRPTRINKIARNYNEHALEYDKLSRQAYPWIYFDKPYIQKNVVPLVNAKIKLLEIGSGSGKVLELFKNKIQEKQMMGVDLSKELVTIAKKNLPGATFKVGDFTKIALPKNKFDIAISVRSIEYLNEGALKRAFKNVYSSLAKGGRFFLITGHPLRINDGDILTYLNRGPRRVSLPWGMKVNLYHKTVADIINAGLLVGFKLVTIDEPDVPTALKRKDPRQYTKYRSYGATNLHIVFNK